MSRLDVFRDCVNDIGAYSRNITKVPLRPYQTRWANYICQVVDTRRNEIVAVEMPRQSGKNETSAQIEVRLLTTFAQRGGEMVKIAPTWKPQIINSKRRIEARATTAARRLPWAKIKGSMGYMYVCGLASLSFLSAEPTASVVGATSSLLMEVDEAQDVQPGKFDKDFSPMRASTNAPLVAYGTTWDDSSLLERFKTDVLEGRSPGRVFQVYPDEVAAHNPAYGEFVDREVARLGREHPFVKTQYFLEPLATAGRMLTDQQLESMIGQHSRETERNRVGSGLIVAGLDFAGGGEDDTGIVDTGSLSRRDSVALTIASVEQRSIADGLAVPVVRILNRHEWIDVNPVTLHSVLYRLLYEVWRVDRLHCDATGIGATSTAFLKAAVEKYRPDTVFGQTFDGQLSTHTRLTFQFLQSVNAGLFLDYVPAGFDPLDEAHKKDADPQDVSKRAWWQRGHAKMQARPGQKVKAYVPQGEGHDDLLLADLLCVDAAYAVGEPLYRAKPKVRRY